MYNYVDYLSVSYVDYLSFCRKRIKLQNSLLLVLVVQTEKNLRTRTNDCDRQTGKRMYC